MTYVRNAWYVATSAHQLVPQRPIGVRILNEPIVIWRNAAGALVAFEDRCAHRLAPLSLGRCEGEMLRCMYHGLLYDRTGRVVEIPGQDRIPDTIQVRTYPVVERHSWVWVWMGDAPADDDLIPPVMGMDYPEYVFSHGQVDYAAEAHLVNDGILDLSHVSFVHAESFRMSETWARQRPTVTEHERSIRSERWIRNEGPLGTVNAEKLVDTYFCYDFFVPGVLLMMHTTHPVGTADALDGQPPDLNQGPEVFISQAVTPLTAKTTRYFYIVGSRRGGDETAVDMATMEKAFAEDKTIIEAQQRNIDITPGWRFTPTTADRGIALFNRIVERLAREESQSIEASSTSRAG